MRFRRCVVDTDSGADDLETLACNPVWLVPRPGLGMFALDAETSAA